MNIPAELCTRCKGYKRLCGLSRCPILEGFQAQVRTYMKLEGLSASGATPPSMIVGEHGYPSVKVYYMIPVGVKGEGAKIYDDPQEWSRRRESISSIVRYRSELLSAEIEVNVRRPEVLYEKEIGLVAGSERPVDSEVKLKRAPIPVLRFDGITKPIGPRAPAEEIRVTENPPVNAAIDKVLWDELKAEEAVRILYDAGVDVYAIHRLLSMGMLGTLSRRKVVPTRWSITATDDMLSRAIRRELRGKKEIGEVRVYYNEYLGDKFFIILRPGGGRVEFLEIWQPRSVWAKGAERPIVWKVEESPTGEASDHDGGFSAARFAILEALRREGRIADIVVVREVTPGYYAPLGSWHVRESVRRAMEEPLMRDPSADEILLALKERIGYDVRLILKRLPLLKPRPRLDDYM